MRSKEVGSEFMAQRLAGNDDDLSNYLFMLIVVIATSRNHGGSDNCAENTQIYITIFPRDYTIQYSH